MDEYGKITVLGIYVSPSFMSLHTRSFAVAHLLGQRIISIVNHLSIA